MPRPRSRATDRRPAASVSYYRRAGGRTTADRRPYAVQDGIQEMGVERFSSPTADPLNK